MNPQIVAGILKKIETPFVSVQDDQYIGLLYKRGLYRGENQLVEVVKHEDLEVTLDVLRSKINPRNLTYNLPQNYALPQFSLIVF